MSLKIIFLVGFVILAVSSLGLGANLNNNPLFNYVGADDNISIPANNVVVTTSELIKSGGVITSATITVKNIDSISHSYKICVITKVGASISDTVGTSPDCAVTTSISASSTGSAEITFSIPLDKDLIDFTGISIQEIS